MHVFKYFPINWLAILYPVNRHFCNRPWLTGSSFLHYQQLFQNRKTVLSEEKISSTAVGLLVGEKEVINF